MGGIILSRTLALIRFEDTGNIYMGVYDGTSDILYSCFASAERCWDEQDQCYKYFDTVSEFCKTNQDISYFESDISNIEIYSDYGGGFSWEGKGVEKCGIVLPKYRNPWICIEPYDPWTGKPNDDYIDVTDGVPEWAQTFMNKIFDWED